MVHGYSPCVGLVSSSGYLQSLCTRVWWPILAIQRPVPVSPLAAGSRLYLQAASARRVRLVEIRPDSFSHPARSPGGRAPGIPNTGSCEVVVITGASGGVGRATAKRFARDGARVALLARGEQQLAGAEREVRELGGYPLAIRVDVADARSRACVNPTTWSGADDNTGRQWGAVSSAFRSTVRLRARAAPRSWLDLRSCASSAPTSPRCSIASIA